MRFGQHLLQNPHLKQFQDANAVYLDTTYCNPKYTFPPQVRLWLCLHGFVYQIVDIHMHADVMYFCY